MITRKIILTFLISVSFFNSAKSQDTVIVIHTPATWVYVGTSTSKNKWYIHNKYLSKENDKIKIWVKLEMDTTTFQKKFYKKPYEMHLVVVDCKNQQIQTIVSTLYNSQGIVIDTYDNPYSKFEYVTPDSVIEAVFEKICSLYN